MILMKKITSAQVLEMIADIATDAMPKNFKGEIFVSYDKDHNIEVFAKDGKKRVVS